MAGRQVEHLADGIERIEIVPQTAWEERAFPEGQRSWYQRNGERVTAPADAGRLRATVTATRSAGARPAAARPAPWTVALNNAITLRDLRNAPKPVPRPVPFAGRYPDAVRDGRWQGAVLGVSHRRDVTALAAHLGFDIINMSPAALRARAGQPAVGLLAHRERTIFVDASLPVAEQLVVVAHELGHLCLGHRSATKTGWDDPHEVAAEAFAHAFLGIDTHR